MTDKPHSGESDYDDPLSLFAPEAAAPALDDELLADGSAYGAPEPAYESSASDLPFRVEHQAAFRSAEAPMPPASFWSRQGSGTFAIVRLTVAFAAISATAFVIGWLVTSGSEPVHTAGDTPTVPARIEPSPVVGAPQPQAEAPQPRVERTQRSNESATQPPARTAAEPDRTPPPDSITRSPFNNPSVSRDPVTPAARVAPPTTPVIVPSPALPDPSPSNTAAAAPSAEPPVPTSSLPPVADSAVRTTLPASSSPAVPAALSTSAPVVEPETSRAAAPTVPPPERPALRPRNERIESTLAGYTNAVAQLSPAAVRAVWPSANVESLTKAFSGLQEMTIKLEKCNIQSLGATAAHASCAGTSRSVPKMGSKTPTVVRQQFEFSLREENDSWVIERVGTKR